MSSSEKKKFTDSNRWDLVPLVSFGPVLFGDSYENYSSLLALHEDENDEDGKDLWTWYSSETHNVAILAINSKIVSVLCENPCYFDGQNLIGLKDTDVLELFKNWSCNRDDDYWLSFDELEVGFYLYGGFVRSVTAGIDPDSLNFAD